MRYHAHNAAMMGSVQMRNRVAASQASTRPRDDSWPILVSAGLVQRIGDAAAAPEARVQLIRGVEGVGTSTLAARVATVEGWVGLGSVGEERAASACRFEPADLPFAVDSL